MITVTNTKAIKFTDRRARGMTKRKPSPLTRFPSITSDAKKLKVSRVHLYLVLSGERTSPELLSDYVDLLKAQGRSLPTDEHFNQAMEKNNLAESLA